MTNKINEIKIKNNNLEIYYKGTLPPPVTDNRYDCVFQNGNYTCIARLGGKWESKEECNKMVCNSKSHYIYPNQQNQCPLKDYNIWGYPAPSSEGNARSLGTFNINFNDQIIPNLVLATSGTRLKGENNNVITVKGNNTFMFARGPCISPPDAPFFAPIWEEGDISYFNLLNKELQFEMKIDNIGSNMNANIYLISTTKGYNKNNGENIICNGAGGIGQQQYCTEIDIIECNLYGAAFTPHICKNAGITSECKTFMTNEPPDTGVPTESGCRTTGCQSKSITKAGKQWFGLDPSTKKPIPNGVDPTQYFTVTTQFTKAGGIITHISQKRFNKEVFNKEVFRMVPENNCPDNPRKCGLPYYECVKNSSENACTKAGGPKEKLRATRNKCDWENGWCNSWGSTKQWPDSDTFSSFKKQLENGLSIVGGIFQLGYPRLQWLSNIQGTVGNTDLKKASISFRNMQINSLSNI